MALWRVRVCVCVCVCARARLLQCALHLFVQPHNLLDNFAHAFLLHVNAQQHSRKTRQGQRQLYQ